MIIKLVLEYDGANYYGFQHQVNLKNIEDEIVKSISNIDKTVVKVYGSGRTDRFVHAKGQVVHFESNMIIDEYKWRISINSFLPDDIKVISVKYMSDDFHARFSVLEKRYSYFIKIDDFSVFDRNYFGYYPSIDIDKMNTTIKVLEGTHNFKGFCSSKINELKDTTRTIYKAEIISHNGYIEIKFHGDGFLRYQVRKMVGSLIEVGLGKLSKVDFIDIINKQDPKLSNKMALAQGLYLMEVIYKED